MAPAISNQKRKRGRPAGAPVANGDAMIPDEAPPEPEPEPAPESKPKPKPQSRDGVRRSKRDRRSIDDNPYWASGSKSVPKQQDKSDEHVAPPKKRARISQGPVAAEPKTKGRHAKDAEQEPSQERVGSQATTSPSTRRKKATKAPDEELQAEEGNQAARRRIRPRLSNQEPADAATISQVAPQSANRRKKVTKPSPEEPNVEEHSQPKRKGRPSLPNQKEHQEAAVAEEESVQPARRKTARKVPADHPAEELAAEPATKARGKGRARLSDTAESANQASHNSRAKPPPAKRSSTAAVVGKAKDQASSQQPQSKVASQQSTADRSISLLDEELSASLPPVPPFRHLEERTRQVPRSTISAMWLPLDEPSIHTVSTIISDTTRPVLVRLRDKEQRYQQGHAILQIFTSRLRSKLRKGMPFPPPTIKPAGKKSEGVSHANELNFENAVDSIEALERTLDPLLDSIKLLEREKAKEEAALKEDYKNLTKLEANARAGARSWKERERRAHALVPERKDNAGVDAAYRLRLADSKGDAMLEGIFHGITEEDLLSETQAIANHMESMRNNLQPLQDILPALGKSKAALHSVLQKHLAPPQFERVLLG